MKHGSTDSEASGATLVEPSETLCGTRSEFCTGAAPGAGVDEFRVMFSGRRSDDVAIDGSLHEMETNKSCGGRRRRAEKYFFFSVLIDHAAD
jgi:hypothetical protein